MASVGVDNQVPASAGRSARETAHVGRVEYTVPIELFDNVDVEMKFLDMNGRPLTRQIPVRVTVFEDQDGTLEPTDAPISSVQTGTLLASYTAGVAILALTDEDGELVVRLNDGAGDTFYLGVAAGDHFSYSPAVVFTA